MLAQDGGGELVIATSDEPESLFTVMSMFVECSPRLLESISIARRKTGKRKKKTVHS